MPVFTWPRSSGISPRSIKRQLRRARPRPLQLLSGLEPSSSQRGVSRSRGLQGLPQGGRGQPVPASGHPGWLQVFALQPPASSSLVPSCHKSLRHPGAGRGPEQTLAHLPCPPQARQRQLGTLVPPGPCEQVRDTVPGPAGPWTQRLAQQAPRHSIRPPLTRTHVAQA